MKPREIWAWLDTNPFTSLWLPPAVFFLQFFVLLALIKSGFPENAPQQELQVSLLLVEGRTTRETAAALFLSPKTVEYHLRKVYTKLGIGSRAELAELLG